MTGGLLVFAYQFCMCSMQLRGSIWLKKVCLSQVI